MTLLDYAPAQYKGRRFYSLREAHLIIPVYILHAQLNHSSLQPPHGLGRVGVRLRGVFIGNKSVIMVHATAYLPIHCRARSSMPHLWGSDPGI